jgi:tRNA(fMet)-specific endonuclease VapC
VNYLLDTSWIVGHLRGTLQIVSRIQEFYEKGLAVSIVSVAELYEGVFRSNQPDANEESLKDFLSTVTVLGITEDVAKRYGEERSKLLHTGNLIGALDLLIAATARTHDLVLLTSDQDFTRIEGLNVRLG